MKKNWIAFLFLSLGLLSYKAQAFMLGVGTWEDPVAHHATCPETGTSTTMDIWAQVWLDPGMIAATALDWYAQKEHNKVTVYAKDAIKALEDALKGGCSAGGGADSSSLSPEAAAAYAPEDVIELAEKDSESDAKSFNDVRESAIEYLFETSDPDVLAECDYQGDEKAKNCAVKRQSEWLLTSIAVASSTADQVLAKTSQSKAVVTHFEKLASQFDAQTSPMAMYGAMAAIVVDTHTRINDANALLARDLEAQSLRTIYESGPVNVMKK